MSEEPTLMDQIQKIVIPICTPAASKFLDKTAQKTELGLNFLNFYALKFLIFINILGLSFIPSYTKELFALYMGFILLQAISFILTCRNNPLIYKITNSLFISFIGPATILLSQDYLFYAMAMSFLAPPLILFLYRRKILAYVSFVLQYIFLNLLYFPSFQKSLMTTAFQDLTHVTNQNFNTFSFIYLANALLLYIIFSMNKGGSSGANSNSAGDIKSQNQLLAKVSSKSQTILNNMIHNLDVAQLEENPLKAREFSANAKLCCELLLSQVDTIVDIRNSESNKFEINYLPERVTDFVERIWSTSSEIIKKRNLFGTLTMQKTLPPVLSIDHQRLMQVILNVLTNSVRFTEKGGSIDISINWVEKETITDAVFEPLPYDDEGGIGEARTNSLIRPVGRARSEDGPTNVLDTHQKRLTEVAVLDEQMIKPKKGILKIVITDTGVGMTQKAADDIFTMYTSNISGADGNSQAGKGFNMWITNQLCEKMGGKMRFFSRPNKGAVCIICVKADIPAPSQIGDGPLMNMRGFRPSHKQLRSIIIDENSYSQDAVKGYLEKAQVEVVGAVNNKQEAIEIYERESRLGKIIQLITVNAHDSVNNAKAICENIRQFESSRNLQPCSILLLAESFAEGELKDCLDANGPAKANNFMQMPIYFPELQKLLASVQSNFVVETREPFKPKKILLVDDLAFNVTLLEKYLEMNGHEFLSAGDGQKALDIYKANWKDIAVIFMDCLMPIMDGYESTKEIRKFQQEKRIPRVKIFGVTGNTGSQAVEDCQAAGMDTAVPKPIVRENFERIVSECLREYQ